MSASNTRSPGRRSSPAPRTCSPADRPGSDPRPDRRRRWSTPPSTTASAPVGHRRAGHDPDRLYRARPATVGARLPAAMVPTISQHRPGASGPARATSAARTAKPSTAVFANGGIISTAATASAVTEPRRTAQGPSARLPAGRQQLEDVLSGPRRTGSWRPIVGARPHRRADALTPAAPSRRRPSPTLHVRDVWWLLDPGELCRAPSRPPAPRRHQAPTRGARVGNPGAHQRVPTRRPADRLAVLAGTASRVSCPRASGLAVDGDGSGSRRTSPRSSATWPHRTASRRREGRRQRCGGATIALDPLAASGCWSSCGTVDAGPTPGVASRRIAPRSPLLPRGVVAHPPRRSRLEDAAR